MSPEREREREGIERERVRVLILPVLSLFVCSFVCLFVWLFVCLHDTHRAVLRLMVRERETKEKRRDDASSVYLFVVLFRDSGSERVGAHRLDGGPG